MVRWMALLLMVAMAPEAGWAQWIEPPGRGWVQAAVYHHDTRNRFDPTRAVTPLFNEGGRSIATSLFLTAVTGIYRGADVWVQVPFHRLAFNDVVEDRLSTGPGDPRVFVRLGPALFGLPEPLPVAVRGGVKVPLGRFNRDAEVVPLSEGQWDAEVLLEVGRSFYPAPLYVMGWAGYRWRGFNDEIDRKPGDERFAYVAAGGRLKRLAWKLAVEGLHGLPPRRRLPSGQQILLALDARELLQLLPSLGYPVGPGLVEVGGRFPVAGRNLPAGPALFVGYFARFGL